jgi:RecA/RadA recombinase
MSDFDFVTDIAKSLKTQFKGIKVMSDDLRDYEFVSTGNLAFDLISDGGIPFGVGTELIGLSASGKSLISQMAIADAQRKYNALGIVADRENAWTPARCEQLGIENKGLIKAFPQDIEMISDAFNFVISTIETVRKKHKDQHIVVVIDSVGAFDKDVDLDKSDSGRRAKSTKDGYRKLFTYLDKKVMIIIVNHFYYNIGQMFGNPLKEAGGEGLKYFNTVRFALQDRKKIIDSRRNNEVVGNWIGVEVIKTRLGPCYRKCYIPHFYDTGIDYYGGYARLLMDRGYLFPKNKKKFNSFDQTTLIYYEDIHDVEENDNEEENNNKENDKNKNKENINEFRIKEFLDKHPELLFDKYPPFYGMDSSTEQDGYIEEDEFEEGEED